MSRDNGTSPAQVGPEREQSSPLLSHDVSTDPEDLRPREQHTDNESHVTEGTPASDDLIRTQPQRLPPPVVLDAGPSDGGSGQQASLSNGTGVQHGGTTRPAGEIISSRHPSPVSHKVQRKLQSSLSMHSDSRSHGSSSGSQKHGATPEDCCVHCILACLFCEFVSLCNLVVAQASCGSCTPDVCCCCCADDMGDDCNCPCDMDCGIMDACCESSDCLEICMECCGICFPT